MLESFFKNVAGLRRYLKETPTQMFSSEYWEVIKNSFFDKTPPVAAFGS